MPGAPRTTRTVRRVAAVALTAVVVSSGVSACSSSGSKGGGSKTLTVYAAASLKGTFTALAKTFESQHKGVTVNLSFGPSSGLATQITQGAPADVFASAAPKNMQTVIGAGYAKGSTNFAKNKGEIALAKGNPGKITSVKDLARSSVTVALCEAKVPCGVVATEVFKNAGITVKPKTYEPDVKTTLAAVTSGQVEAGLVYVTDVRAAGSSVEGLQIPDDLNATTEYPIAALSKSKNATLAQQFVTLVTSSQGQQVLAKAGFEAP